MNLIEIWYLLHNFVNPYLSITTRLNATYTINDGNIGCGMSHLDIIKDCIINNYNNVLILEDDFEFIIYKN